jgi:hypothetical protein
MAAYNETYVVSDEQRERYRTKSKERYANDPAYRAAKLESARKYRAKAKRCAVEQGSVEGTA